MRLPLAASILVFALTSPVAFAQAESPRAAKPSKGAITINALADLLKARFPEQVKSGKLKLDTGDAGSDKELLGELKDFRIKSLRDVSALIPSDFDTRGAVEWQGEGTNIAGLLRDLMMLKDLPRYLSTTWKNKWYATGEGDFALLQAYGIGLKPLYDAGVMTAGAEDEDSGSEAGD